MRFWLKHLLDDLEERSVKLGKYLIAVFKLKANIVGLHPCYVLNKEGRKGATHNAIYNDDEN